MELLEQINITRAGQGPAVIQLLQGDLTALPREHAADILIISAYPGSYIPVEGTLIAALENKGLDVDDLSKHKAIDLREQLGCWLSQPLNAAQQELFNFKKVLCFEPWHQTTDQATVVGNIFRCINTFAFSESNNVIAMPVLASGQQKVSFEKMLPAMLDASIFWMESGLPLNCIKLVLFSDKQAKLALPVFTRAKQQNDLKQAVRDGNITGINALKILETNKKEQLPDEAPMQIVVSEINEMAQKEEQGIATIITAAPGQAVHPTIPARPPSAKAFPGEFPLPPPATPVGAQANPSPDAKTAAPANTQYDYFVSYAHKHAAIVDVFVTNLTAANKDLQIFYDKSSIPPGGLWIKQISDAIQKSKKILIFLSPDYSNSPVCWDEFQCAKLVEYNSRQSMIQTIYLYNDTAMPLMMGIYSYIDCREGDQEKLQQIVASLLPQKEMRS